MTNTDQPHLLTTYLHFVKPCSHFLFFTVLVSGTFDLFEPMCEHYNRNTFNPFLNDEKKTQSEKMFSVNKPLEVSFCERHF